MNLVDLVVFALLVYGLVTGARRGLWEQLLRLLQVLVAAFLGHAASGLLLPLIDKFSRLPEGRARELGPYLAGFLLVYLFLLGVLGLNRARLKELRGNRAGGALVGAARIAVLVSVLLLVPAWMAAGDEPGALRSTLAESRAVTAASRLVGAIDGVLAPAAYTTLLAEIERPADLFAEDR